MELPKSYYGYANELPLDDVRHILYEEQRAERGFDDTETWSLDFVLLRFLVPRLERLIEIRNEVFDLDDKHKAEMDEMLLGFKLYLDEGAAQQEEPIKNARKSFKLLAKNFRRLWW